MNPLTMNGYNYANNNPVMMVDPDGELPLLIPVFMGALEGFLGLFITQAVKQTAKNAIKNKILPVITTLVKKYGKNLRFTGPKRSGTNSDNHTLFTVYSKQTQVLRVYMKVLFRFKEYIGDVHYHVTPRMEIHRHLFDVPFGKNLKKFPW